MRNHVEERLVRSNKDVLVTETTIDTKMPPDTLLSYLKGRSTTGSVTFHLIQGGIRQIVVVEKTKVPEPKRDNIRDSLGI